LVTYTSSDPQSSNLRAVNWFQCTLITHAPIRVRFCSAGCFFVLCLRVSFLTFLKLRYPPSVGCCSRSVRRLRVAPFCPPLHTVFPSRSMATATPRTSCAFSHSQSRICSNICSKPHPHTEASAQDRILSKPCPLPQFKPICADKAASADTIESHIRSPKANTSQSVTTACALPEPRLLVQNRLCAMLLLPVQGCTRSSKANLTPLPFAPLITASI
jgi:hypothetical protein